MSKKMCITCMGNGYVLCEECDGKGHDRVILPGTEKLDHTCNECEGEGRFECEDCKGVGYIYE